MGTLAQKFLTNVAGVITEKASISTTSGVADADKLVATDAAGIIDPSLVNATDTSAGAADAGKIAQLDASGILDSSIVNSTVTSTGASDAGKLTALDSSGHLDLSVMPTGVGPDTQSILASEAISAGAYVNIWNNTGTANIRNADNTAAGKEAHGYVLSAVGSGANGLVYFSGNNVSVTGATVGNVYLGTVGAVVSTAPSGSGNVVQRIGEATSATSVNTNLQQPIVLA